jgi:hypothetical protein
MTEYSSVTTLVFALAFAQDCQIPLTLDGETALFATGSSPPLYTYVFGEVAAVQVLAEVRELELQVDEYIIADGAPAAAERATSDG